MDDNLYNIRVPGMPSDGEGGLVNAAGDFIVSLMQALLRTGYYTPEHPQSEKARAGLYGQFERLVLNKEDLSFLIHEKPEKKLILVEGMLSEPCYLTAFMPSGMADLYTEKLMLFLTRKELISMTLKQKMGEAEFHDFIEVISKPILVDIHDRSKRDRFIAYLQEKGIKNVSFIFNEDLIQCERNIPWRAWIAMSRLKKDVSMIPILRNLSQEDLKEVKREVVFDVLRPLQDPGLSFATLVHSDLIRSQLMPEEEIEEDIILSLSEDKLIACVELFMQHHARLTKTVNRKTYEDKLGRILRKCTARLEEVTYDTSEPLFEKLHKQGFLSLEELPQKYKDKVVVEKFMDAYLEDPKSFLTYFNSLHQEDRYRPFLKSLMPIVPLLIERDRVREVLSILFLLKKHAKEITRRGEAAAESLEEIGSGRVPLILKRKFMAANKEIRLSLYPVFVHLENSMAPHLLAIIEETGDRWVRKNALELLLQMGAQARSRFEEGLGAGRYRSDVILDVVKAVLALHNEEVCGRFASILSEHVSSPDAELRKYMLILIAQAGGASAEAALLKALRDPSAVVKKIAVNYLGLLKSRKALPVFLELLEGIGKSPSPEGEEMEDQVYQALGYLEPASPEGGPGPEEVLLQVLQQRGKHSAVSFLFFSKRERPLRDKTIAVICEALGRVGSRDSIPVLKELAGNRSRPWHAAALEAIELIEKRSLAGESEGEKAQPAREDRPIPPS
jgi:hypothetical protein